MKQISFFLLCCLLALPAVAEYRVFLNQIRTAEGEVVREFPSTLDPDQYPGYYPVPAGQHVVYVDTWMCKGNTGRQEFCKSPRQLASEQAEQAGETTPAAESPAPPPVPLPERK